LSYILQDSINANKRNIVSNLSGIVSYVIDGYETPEMLGMIKVVENRKKRVRSTTNLLSR